MPGGGDHFLHHYPLSSHSIRLPEDAGGDVQIEPEIGLLCSLEYRGGELHAYWVDSAVTSYSYFHGRLLDWLVERINAQADEGPLESIAGWLERAGHPARALISIGATRYTGYGEQHFLEAGDSSIVVAYDARRYDEETLRELALRDDAGESPAVSLLRQRVE